MRGSNHAYSNRIDNVATQSAKGFGGSKAPSAGSGEKPQSETVFGKYLIEWSLFSSIVYHVRKIAQYFEYVDDVVILF